MQAEGREEVQIPIRVERFVFRAGDSPFAVVRVDHRGAGLTVTGPLAAMEEGAEYEVTGHYVTHPRYGQQLEVTGYRPLTPHSPAGMITYLASDVFPGVGRVTAERIVDAFGEDTLRIIEEEPQRLKAVEGIGEATAMAIAEAYQEGQDLQDYLLFLTDHGIPLGTGLKIHDEYGDRAREVLESNPYQLCEQVYGVGFKTADRIALQLGQDRRGLNRLAAAVTYVLRQAAYRRGHLFLPLNQLAENVSSLLEEESGWDYHGEVEVVLDRLVASGEVVVEAGRVYLERLQLAECGIVDHLDGLLRAATSIRLDGVQAASLVERVESELVFDLADQQREAVESVFRSGLCVMTGGPGTGKTTVCQAVIAGQRDLVADAGVLLCAPTGRAAKRLEELTGEPASTIHRLLDYQVVQGQGFFGRNEASPLEGELLVVDEASMLDINLAYALLRAIPAGMRVLLTGDADQLPPVGPGMFFRDLIETGTLPVTRLTEVFRQADRSPIIGVAHAIKNGRLPRIDQRQDEVQFVQQGGATEVRQQLVERAEALLKERQQQGFERGEALSEVQVLTPVNRGPLGIEELNPALQECLNPAAASKAELTWGSTTYRQGDKVMCLRNNYRKGRAGIFNGNLGEVIACLGKGEAVPAQWQGALEGNTRTTASTLLIDFSGERIAYTRSESAEINLAYAITVHKSQGSEFWAVLMPLTTQHYRMLQRNLLYTAVTRARERLQLVGAHKALAIAVRNNQVEHRNSLLQQRLQALGGQ